MALGNSNFGFSGGGGSTPPPATTEWLLDGNTVGSQKYFGTNDNYSIPIYTNGVARGIFTSTGDFGFGMVLPTARVHIQGVDSTSANYAMKIDNSASSPLLYSKNNGDIGFGCVPTNAKFEFSGGNILLLSYGARFSSIGIGAYSSWSLLGNEISTLEVSTGTPLIMQYTEAGRVGIGTNSPTAGTRLHVYRAVNDFLYEVKVENPTNGNSAASSILIQSNSGKLEFGQLSTLFTTFTGYGQTGDTFIRSGTGSRNLNIISDASNVGKILFFSRLNPTTDAASPSLCIDGSRSGFNRLAQSDTVVSIKGTDATSANYAMKIDNSASTPLFYVRNDGHVDAGLESGAASGSMSIGFSSASLLDINNTFIGIAAGFSSIAGGNRNTGVGHNSLIAITNGSRNTAVGDISLASLTTGFGNTSMGWAAGSALVGGTYATSIGYAAMASNTNGSNTAVGANAGINSTGTGLTLFGASAWEFGTTGVSNAVFGTSALMRNSTGSRNSVFGETAGNFNVAAGSDNIFIGYQSGYFNNDTGNGLGTVGRSKNTFIGSLSGQAYTGSESVIIGYSAGASAITGTKQLIIDNADNAVPLIYGDFNTRQLAFGTVSPSAKLHVQGVDATSGNYALKVDNSASASSPLLYVRNDGNVGVGIAAPSILFQVNSPLATASNYMGLTHNGNFQTLLGYDTLGGNILLKSAGGLSTILNINSPLIGTGDFINTSRNFTIGSNTTSAVKLEVVGAGSTDYIILSKTGVGGYQSVLAYGALGGGLLLKNPASSSDLVNFNSDLSGSTSDFINTGRNLAIGLTSATAKLHIEGDFKTAQPSANGAGAWKFGKIVAAASVLDAANYIEVEIDGVIRKLALIA